MKLQRCVNGHFYDGDKYSSCPHCQNAGLQGSSNDETVTVPLNRTPGAVSSGTIPVGMGGGNTVPVNYSDESVTMPITQPAQGSRMPVMNNSGNGGMVSMPDDEGKTIGIYGNVFENKPAPKTSKDEYAGQTSPCAGWLVCVGGMHVGRDFRLYVGRNTIGRSDSNSVALSGDTSVSKEPQAIIVYEPQGNRFFAVPGTARSLAYVNGQVLLAQTQLNKNDIIELGGTKLMLIPCCDEKFNWNTVFAK